MLCTVMKSHHQTSTNHIYFMKNPMVSHDLRMNKCTKWFYFTNKWNISVRNYVVELFDGMFVILARCLYCRFFIAKIYRIYRLNFSFWCIKWCGSHKEKRRAGSQYPSIHLNLKYSFMYFMVNLMLLEQSNASTYLYNILSTILKEPMVCQMY